MPSVNCYLPHKDEGVYAPYSEGSMFGQESQMEMVVEQNLVLQLQWLMAGNLGPMPEEFYPSPDMIEYHWNLSANILDSFLEIECPKPGNHEDFKYSKRLTMLDYNAVYDRLAEILCPYVTTPGHSFEMTISLDFGADGRTFRSMDYYKRSRRVWRGGATEPVWEDSMEVLFRNFDEMASDIIRHNNGNGSMAVVSFNSGSLTPSEQEHLERVYQRVHKSNQVCYLP
jgi:hypothetical protein